MFDLEESQAKIWEYAFNGQVPPDRCRHNRKMLPRAKYSWS
jgi:hypothetical protein